MTFWGGVLCVFLAAAGVAILVLALLHVRYRAAWSGAWSGDFSLPRDGFLRLELGFPGFMRKWEWVGDGRRESGVGEEKQPRQDADDAFSASSPTAKSSTQQHDGKSYVKRDASSVAQNPPPPPPPPPDSRLPTPDSHRRRRNPNRWRKALFRLATDGPVWARLARF